MGGRYRCGAVPDGGLFRWGVDTGGTVPDGG